MENILHAPTTNKFTAGDIEDTPPLEAMRKQTQGMDTLSKLPESEPRGQPLEIAVTQQHGCVKKSAENSHVSSQYHSFHIVLQCELLL